MTSVRKAIIPVAGYGIRFLPATKSIPKEMLPVVDKPQLQYLVEEVVASGITDIIFVTGRNKHSIENHFDVSLELETVLARAKKPKELKQVQKISQMADFAYIRQPMPLGHGDAILRAANLLSPNEPFAVIFGDDLIDSKTPALKQMLPAFQKYHAPIIALAKVSQKEATKFGVVRVKPKGDRVYQILDFVEKPKRAPSPYAVIGKYILTPDFLQTLKHMRRRGKELNLGDAIPIYIQKGMPVYGVEIEGTWYDCGSKLGYLKANINYAMKHKDLRNGLRSSIIRKT